MPRVQMQVIRLKWSANVIFFAGKLLLLTVKSNVTSYYSFRNTGIEENDRGRLKYFDKDSIMGTVEQPLVN